MALSAFVSNKASLPEPLATSIGANAAHLSHFTSVSHDLKCKFYCVLLAVAIDEHVVDIQMSLHSRLAICIVQLNVLNSHFHHNFKSLRAGIVEK